MGRSCLRDDSAEAAAFDLSVYPTELKGDAVAGQMVVLLVTVSNGSGAVKVAAIAPGAAVAVQPGLLSPGQVGEVSVIPGIDSVGSNVTVTITAEKDGLIQDRTLTFFVYQGQYTEEGHARRIRDAFVGWLQAAHPELGITNQTQWLGTVVSPHWLVVSHYLFFSSGWEMHVYWHVMIPPYDWARVDLRQRGTALTPTVSFEISSMSANLPPHEIPASNSTWR